MLASAMPWKVGFSPSFAWLEYWAILLLCAVSAASSRDWFANCIFSSTKIVQEETRNSPRTVPTLLDHPRCGWQLPTPPLPVGQCLHWSLCWPLRWLVLCGGPILDTSHQEHLLHHVRGVGGSRGCGEVSGSQPTLQAQKQVVFTRHLPHCLLHHHQLV